MTIQPFLDAPFIIQLHMLFAIPAILAAPIALWRSRRDQWHRLVGYVWVIGIAGLALTGLMIPSAGLAVIGHMGPIHLFSVMALWGILDGIRHARARRVRAHRQAMESTCFGALGLAGLFTFIPGRRMNQIVFGEPSQMGWIIVAAGAAALATLWWWQRRGPARFA